MNKEQLQHPQADKLFSYTFRVVKKVAFEVSYNFVGSNRQPYFATSCGILNHIRTDWNIAGQSQEEALPKGLARDFYMKWDNYHLKKLDDNVLNELLEDVEELKNKYPFIEGDRFYRFVELDRECSKRGR